VSQYRGATEVDSDCRAIAAQRQHTHGVNAQLELGLIRGRVKVPCGSFLAFGSRDVARGGDAGSDTLRVECRAHGGVEEGTEVRLRYVKAPTNGPEEH